MIRGGRRIARRGLLAAGAGVLLAPGAGLAGEPVSRALAGIEADLGGRIGVAALDGCGRVVAAWRGGERFALCSTFKVALAACVLERIDRGDLSGDDDVAIREADLLAYAPVTRVALPQGRMTIFDLCAAALEMSDNTAANLLLARVGGPPGVTARLRAWGDRVTRLDRIEPDLNSNLAGDPRDTTTPVAYALTVRRLLTGAALSDGSRARLTGWLVGCRTGLAKLRAGLPRDWRVGDKTGAGDHGGDNDVAIAWPPGRAPVVLTSYLSGSMRPASDRADAHRAIAAALVGTLVRR